MKWIKKVLGASMAAAMILSLSVSALAAKTETSNMVEEPVDQGGQITRVDIPNADGTFTTLEGDKAQEWYDGAVEEGKQRVIEESSMQVMEDKDEVETRGSFRYKYRYLESKHTNNVEGQNLKKQLLIN